MANRIGRRRLIAIGSVLVAVVLAAGCGGDDEEGEASTSIEAEATEFEFDPDTWTVPAGDQFSITLTNEGSIAHEWAVIKLGEDIESEAEFEEDKVLLEVEAIDAGTSTTQTFTIAEPGTYQVICAIEGHFDAGMEGRLTVR